MKIQITQADIDQPASFCPIQSALRRDGHKGAKVNTFTFVAEGRKRVLSTEAFEWMGLWESGQPVSPVELELDADPERTARLSPMVL